MSETPSARDRRRTGGAPHPPLPSPIEPLERRLAFSVPPGFADLQVAAGLAKPVAFDFAPDGRVFVAEQGGNLRVIKDGSLLPTPFATFDVNDAAERGLLGVAFDPDFARNQFVYVFYTATTPRLHNRVVRLTAAGDVAAPGSETPVLELDDLNPGAAIHNGGSIRFGPDGKLYVATGENARPDLAQDLSSTHGKILRVNPDGSVPPDNPFANTPGARPSIWAYGLRNPFTFDIHRTTGQMFINDVGAATWEEIDEGAAGANYGWPRSEGPTSDPAFRAPLFAYHHNQGDPRGCSIVGGTFYDPPNAAFPAEYHDDYFFSDGCNRWIYRRDAETGAVTPFATEVGPAFNVSTGPDGSLYYAVYSGEIRKISARAADTAPAINRPPAAAEAAAGQPATFSVEAAGREPLSYQWQRDGQDIPGATGSSYTLPAATAADHGAAFRVVVTNELGSVTSAAATLSVVTDAPPTGVITSPKEGRLYKAGQRISFRGRATDPEDGKLPKGAFTWEVVFHHDEHTHPFMPAAPGSAKGSFRIPDTGETSANVWYRVHLTVTDSKGLTHHTFRDVHPRTVTLTAAAAPPGAQLFLDGQPITAPFTFTSVAGLRRTLEAPETQGVNGTSYAFRKWDRGRGRLIELVTPSKDRTYTAAYEVAGG